MFAAVFCIPLCACCVLRTPQPLAWAGERNMEDAHWDFHVSQLFSVRGGEEPNSDCLHLPNFTHLADVLIQSDLQLAHSS
jgi:hypothetical protein